MARKRVAAPAPAPEVPEVQPEAEVKKRGRGRPPKAKEGTVLPEALGEGLEIKHIPLSSIDLQDTQFRFRASIRVADLKKSIEAEGQQIPAVVRQKPGGGYQLISGFRRATALKELGAKTIAAYVRDDLDNEGAFRASVLENQARKSYSDIDRALVLKAYEEQGFHSFEVEELLALTKRQRNNLKSLLDLPPSVQEAIGDPDNNFTATHALTLRKLKKKYPKLVYDTWIKRVNAENLSIAQLVRAVNEVNKDKNPTPAFKSLFRQDGTDFAQGNVRFKPVKFNVQSLSDEERGKLKDELSRVLALLEAPPAKPTK